MQGYLQSVLITGWMPLRTGVLMSDVVNVLLLCRNSIIREGLSRILAERDFNIVQATGPNHYESTDNECVPGETPELVLIDNGAEECDTQSIVDLQARFPHSNLVMLSDRFDFQIMLQAFRLGMRAYIVKEISCDRLVGSLRLVAMGERVLPSQLADELQSRPAFENAPEMEQSVDAACLSEREREILRWLIMGCPNKVISRRMEISEATVKVHVKAVLRKLGVKNRTQAAIWAANHGMRGRCYDLEPAMSDIPHPAQLPVPAPVAIHV
jgi:two-component system, NarL family, nitrate/nitrite response regulator NarL